MRAKTYLYLSSWLLWRPSSLGLPDNKDFSIRSLQRYSHFQTSLSSEDDDESLLLPLLIEKNGEGGDDDDDDDELPEDEVEDDQKLEWDEEDNDAVEGSYR